MGTIKHADFGNIVSILPFWTEIHTTVRIIMSEGTLWACLHTFLFELRGKESIRALIQA